MVQRVPWRLIGLLLLFWFIGLQRLPQPYYGVRDNLQVWVPAAVRNFDHYGADTLNYVPTRNVVLVDDLDELDYYAHHPPMIVWLPSIVTKFIGYHELGMRFVFFAGTMITISAFYVLVRRAFDADVAFWAAFLFSVSPMIAYNMVGYSLGSLGFLPAMLFGAVFINWWRRPTTSRTVLLTALLIWAVWTAWPAVFMVASISGILGFAWDSMKQRGIVVGWGLLTILMFAGMMTFYEVARPGSIESLLDAFVWRSSNASYREGSESFTVFEWFGRNSLHILMFGTIGTVGLALLGFRTLLRRGTQQGKLVVLALFCGSAAYLLIFRNAAFIHDYYKAWLMPSLTIVAAVAVAWLRPRARRIRGVVDGLVLAVVMQAIILMALLLGEFRKPDLDATLDYINANVPKETALLVTNDIWEERLGFEKVIGFYTNWEFYLNVPIERVRELAGETIIHIDCTDAELEDAELVTELVESCKVWQHNS